MPRIFMASLGCVKNLVDAETMLGETLDDDFTLELDPAAADVIIVNTCGFIADAREESRDAIAEYLDIKRNADRPVAVVATGCLAERTPQLLLADFPELDAVWGLNAPSSLRDSLRALGKAGEKAAWLGKPAAPREGARLVSTLPSFAYLRLSDGCDNRCRYCAIPLIRGVLRSRPPAAVVEEAKTLEQQGVKELTLIAQDTTAYGSDDPAANPGLAPLLETLLDAVSVPRLRLLYAHPGHIDDRTIDLLVSEPRLCRYVDLPLQHISDRVLKAMNRGYDSDRALSVLERLAKGGVVIRSTLLAGFPGETEEDFRETVDLVRAGWFRHLGVFAYSPEEGTPAADFPDRVPAAEAARRRDALMAEQRKKAFAWLNSRIGKTEDILLDAFAGDGILVGRSTSEAPDADGMIYVRCNGQPGDMVKACIKAREGYDLIAETGEGTDRRRRRRR